MFLVLEAMPLRMEGGRILALGPAYQNNIMGSVRRARGLSDIAPQYVAKVCMIACVFPRICKGSLCITWFADEMEFLFLIVYEWKK